MALHWSGLKMPKKKKEVMSYLLVKEKVIVCIVMEFSQIRWWTDFEFRNTGLDVNPDSGLAQVTKKSI